MGRIAKHPTEDSLLGSKNGGKETGAAGASWRSCLEMGDRVRRYNAWNCPLSFRQVVTITVCIGNAVAYIFFLHPLLNEGNEEVGLESRRFVALDCFTILFVASFAVTVLCGICTMTIDPVDPLVVQAEEGDHEVHEEILWCRYCRASVQLDSKHCWDCNKCVANFDHHCPWLNTCIGTRNYAWFYVAIWSFLVMLGTTSTAGCLVLVEHTRESPNPLGLDVLYVWIIGVILSVINISLCFLDLTLVVFHTYLCIRRITTYEYITGKVSKRKREQKDKGRERRDGESERGAAYYAYAQQVAPPASNIGGSIVPTIGGSTVVTNNLHPRAHPTFSSPYAAAVPQESQEESSEASSSADSDEGYSQGGVNVFRSFVAQEGDTEMKKEVSSVIFGSSVTGIGEPEQSPTPSQSQVRSHSAL